MKRIAYSAGVRRALEKLGLEYAPTTPDEINLARDNNYDNDRRHEPPAGLGIRPTTDTTGAKEALYTSWSGEEPAVRQITSEEQTGGQLASPPPHQTVEPATTTSESAEPTPNLLGQLKR